MTSFNLQTAPDMVKDNPNRMFEYHNLYKLNTIKSKETNSDSVYRLKEIILGADLKFILDPDLKNKIWPGYVDDKI